MQEFANAEIERFRCEKTKRQIDDSQELKATSEYLYERKVDPKFKISTPNGTVSTRKKQPKWTYDEAKLLEFLKQNGKYQYIRIKEEINKAELKKNVKAVNGKVITEEGEIVEGITVTEQGEELVVRVVD